jgi:transcription elongation factor GreA
MIDLDASGGARAQILLRDKPRSATEEIEELFFSAGADFASRVAAVQKLSQPEGAGALTIQLLRRMIEHLEKEFRVAEESDPIKTLGIAFLIEDLKSLDSALKHHVSPIPHPDKLLQSVHDYSTLLDMEHIDHAVRGLHHLLARDGTDGAERAAQLLPNAPVKLAQAIWKEFDLEHHRAFAISALGQVLDRPFENPETYLWAVKLLLEEQAGDLEGEFNLPDLVMNLLGKLDDWNGIATDSSSGRATAAAAQQLVGRVRTMLGARNYAAICAAAENMTLDQAQRLRTTIAKCDALNSTFKGGAARQLVLTRKDLDHPAAGEPRRAAEADFHICTPRARHEKMLELREITSVKIPANSRAIEEARQEGDLRENAGYHAAKDEQKIMMQQMLTLQEALGAARVMHKEMIKTGSIMFGTRFTAENKNTGATESYTLLGKWEADHTRNVLSIQAPFAQQFLGKEIGDEFEVNLPVGGSVPYRVISIENALASGEWDEEESDTPSETSS